MSWDNNLGIRFKGQSDLKKLTDASLKKIHRVEYSRPQLGYLVSNGRGLLTFLKMKDEVSDGGFLAFQESLDHMFNSHLVSQYVSEKVEISGKEWIHISFFLNNPIMTTSIFATLYDKRIYVCSLGCKKEHWEEIKPFYHEVIRTVEFDVWDEV